MQKAALRMIHVCDILGRGTTRKMENSNSCWGVGMSLLQRDTGEFSGGVGTVLYLNLGGYMTICVDQNSKNYTVKRVHFTV